MPAGRSICCQVKTPPSVYTVLSPPSPSPPRYTPHVSFLTFTCDDTGIDRDGKVKVEAIQQVNPDGTASAIQHKIVRSRAARLVCLVYITRANKPNRSIDRSIDQSGSNTPITFHPTIYHPLLPSTTILLLNHFASKKILYHVYRLPHTIRLGTDAIVLLRLLLYNLPSPPATD